MSKEFEIDEINKINIVRRLKKIEGQIRGIQGMVLDNRSCEDILMQVSAVKAALHRINKLILEKEVYSCFHFSEEMSFSQNTLDEVIDLIIKFVR
jgi:CsoR family transcriptional regulator, copper-sensing transcriptional repressor